jgi:hypothetical protein
MHSSQQLDRCVRIDLDDIVRDEAHAHVDLVGPNRSVDGVQWNLDILDVIEALDFEQLFGHVLRRNTNPGNLGKADGRYFGRSLLSRSPFTANQGYGCGR